MAPGLFVGSAEVSLAQELANKDNHPDQKPGPEVGLRNLESAADGKLHKKHQNHRKNGVHECRYHGVPAGFAIGCHRFPLAQRKNGVLNTAARIRCTLQTLNSVIPLLEIGVSRLASI